MSDRVEIIKLPTGVPGLDEVLGGGVPEYSFNLIAGGPGGGKTTLAHQIVFANATAERPALYVTILGEPPLKMLRYQQQFAFFDPARVGKTVRFLHLGAALLEGGLEKVLECIVQEVEATNPKIVAVDSFRSVVRHAREGAASDLQSFVQRLCLHLTSWEATTFLVGEYEEFESESNPILTVADGIVWLAQETHRNSIVRKLRVMKMRGQAQVPGLHTLKISDAGVRVYPRLPNPDAPTGQKAPAARERRRTGVAGLDEMLGGGVPAGYSIMVVGPSGSGKTVLSTQFIREGIARGEAGVIAVFEKRPQEYLTTAPDAPALNRLIDDGKLRMLNLRPLDLSVDETMEEIAQAVHAIGAKRVVIDSLSGFELALAPTFREDFRESVYRMVGALLRLDVTVMMTAEIVDSYAELRLNPHGVSFLSDGIILQRYTELGGRLRRVTTVAKMRGVAHSDELRFYDIDDRGIAIGEGLTEYEHVLVGTPRRLSPGDDRST